MDLCVEDMKLLPMMYPCVDCGLLTVNWCDGSSPTMFRLLDTCYASDHVPHDYPVKGGYGNLRTPLCQYCETCSKVCRFCLGKQGCTPPARRTHWSGLPMEMSRSFTAEEFSIATRREFEIRDAMTLPEMRLPRKKDRDVPAGFSLQQMS